MLDILIDILVDLAIFIYGMLCFATFDNVVKQRNFRGMHIFIYILFMIIPYIYMYFIYWDRAYFLFRN